MQHDSSKFKWIGNFDVNEYMYPIIKNAFDFVFLAHGMNGFNQLGIPNEDLENIIDVKTFVES